MPEWQPIQTAPKDGTRILVWPCWADGTPEVVKWVKMRRAPDRWEVHGGTFLKSEPTHWMPLPDPPK